MRALLGPQGPNRRIPHFLSEVEWERVKGGVADLRCEVYPAK